MMFVRVKDETGKDMMVNFDHVRQIEQTVKSDEISLTFTDDSWIRVKCGFETMYMTLRRAES